MAKRIVVSRGRFVALFVAYALIAVAFLSIARIQSSQGKVVTSILRIQAAQKKAVENQKKAADAQKRVVAANGRAIKYICSTTSVLDGLVLAAEGQISENFENGTYEKLRRSGVLSTSNVEAARVAQVQYERAHLKLADRHACVRSSK